ncbi:FadR/GntR family transcriptional regulator [Clostridium psychrophilum]|uniref:FadR/GntR family transcriptional regulator n=1 Tax=Clostridium psychrophilum TaxID=132926 RepID=UPI001C0D26C1|nr:FadR/GntR family transcriptional regulator [Clostridium psychrophilum]MBU3182168.1 FadR family transcriptional regulator [Clostridium psychrophilum]
MVNKIKVTKVYKQVIQQIKNMISDGTLKIGDKLPSERELVEKLKVSRSSIREALRSMENIGLIECRQGEGNFIGTNTENSLYEPLSIMFLLQKNTSQEIFELRMAIEVETVELASKKINSQELQELKLLVIKMKETYDRNLSISLDKEFHYKIAQAAHNILILNMMNAVSSLVDEYRKDALIKIVEIKENTKVLGLQHENIYNALSENNLEDSVKAMKVHINFSNEYMTNIK